MEKNSLDNNPEAVEISRLAQGAKQKLEKEGEEKGEPTRDDYNRANGWVEDEKIEKEASATLKNLKNIDLSNPEGRMAVAQMYFAHKTKAPRFEGPKDKYGHTVSLDIAIEHSVPTPKELVILVNKESILRDLHNISSFYGHDLVKVPENLRTFLMGWDHRISDYPEMKNKNNEEADKFLFSYILDYAGTLSSQILNGCLSMAFLVALYKKIKAGEITEEMAKTHPNYVAVEELVLKADIQQKILSNILFKILSSYIHTNHFSSPSLGLEIETKKRIFKKLEEMCYLKQEDQLSKTLTRDITRSIVDSFSFNSDLEAEIKGLTEYIDFFQPILEKYDSMMTYHSADTKKE